MNEYVPSFIIYKQGESFYIYDVANHRWEEEFVSYPFGGNYERVSKKTLEEAKSWVAENTYTYQA